jgi:phosphate acyltransferase
VLHFADRRYLWRFPVRAAERFKTAQDQVSGTFMPQKVRIALDAMGGDVGASVVIPGAAISLSRHPDTEFLLFGQSALIEAQLAKHPAMKAASRVIHTDVAVSMNDKPSQALRRGRKTSSMWLAIDAVKKGEADVAVSAGNTGALMAMARFNLHMLHGIVRRLRRCGRRCAAIRWCSTSAPRSAATRII